MRVRNILAAALLGGLAAWAGAASLAETVAREVLGQSKDGKKVL